MKNTDQPTVGLILPDGFSHHGFTREKFAALIRVSDLAKIEKVLKLPSPSEGLRQSLISVFWEFYVNSSPEAEIKRSRAALKKELEEAAELAENLERSAEQLWKSTDPVIFEHLHHFAAMWLPSQSSRPMHRSGIGFVGALNEFALTTRWLASALKKDSGGTRPAKPFDDLTIALAGHYSFHSKSEATTSSKDPFFGLMAVVVNVLRKIESKLRAEFDLPTTDPASLEMRLRRLASRIQKAGGPSRMCSCGHQLGYHAGQDGACILAQCDCKGFDAVDPAASTLPSG
jgi:hypothetical protein